jgi:hypothetical protein
MPGNVDGPIQGITCKFYEYDCETFEKLDWTDAIVILAVLLASVFGCTIAAACYWCMYRRHQKQLEARESRDDTTGYMSSDFDDDNTTFNLDRTEAQRHYQHRAPAPSQQLHVQYQRVALDTDAPRYQTQPYSPANRNGVTQPYQSQQQQQQQSHIAYGSPPQLSNAESFDTFHFSPAVSTQSTPPDVTNNRTTDRKSKATSPISFGTSSSSSSSSSSISSNQSSFVSDFAPTPQDDQLSQVSAQPLPRYLGQRVTSSSTPTDHQSSLLATSAPR